jgi:hypothetical protein
MSDSEQVNIPNVHESGSWAEMPEEEPKELSDEDLIFEAMGMLFDYNKSPENYSRVLNAIKIGLENAQLSETDKSLVEQINKRFKVNLISKLWSKANHSLSSQAVLADIPENLRMLITVACAPICLYSKHIKNFNQYLLKKCEPHAGVKQLDVLMAKLNGSYLLSKPDDEKMFKEIIGKYLDSDINYIPYDQPLRSFLSVFESNGLKEAMKVIRYLNLYVVEKPFDLRPTQVTKVDLAKNTYADRDDIAGKLAKFFECKHKPSQSCQKQAIYPFILENMEKLPQSDNPLHQLTLYMAESDMPFQFEPRFVRTSPGNPKAFRGSDDKIWVKSSEYEHIVPVFYFNESGEMSCISIFTPGHLDPVAHFITKFILIALHRQVCSYFYQSTRLPSHTLKPQSLASSLDFRSIGDSRNTVKIFAEPPSHVQVLSESDLGVAFPAIQ